MLPSSASSAVQSSTVTPSVGEELPGHPEGLAATEKGADSEDRGVETVKESYSLRDHCEGTLPHHAGRRAIYLTLDIKGLFFFQPKTQT